MILLQWALQVNLYKSYLDFVLIFNQENLFIGSTDVPTGTRVGRYLDRFVSLKGHIQSFNKESSEFATQYDSSAQAFIQEYDNDPSAACIMQWNKMNISEELLVDLENLQSSIVSAHVRLRAIRRRIADDVVQVSLSPANLRTYAARLISTPSGTCLKYNLSLNYNLRILYLPFQSPFPSHLPLLQFRPVKQEPR